MLNRRDFLKAGTGLIASAFFPYSHAEGRQLIKRCDIGNNYELLINHIYSVIQKISHRNARLEQADILAVFCAKRGYGRKAVEILNDSKSLAQKLHPNSLMESAKAYCYMAQYEQAHKAVYDARQNLFDTNKEHYNAAAIAHIEYYFYADVIEIARILIKKNNKDMALLLLEDTLKYSSDGLLFPADNRLIKLLAEAYCDLGEHNKAEEIADRIIAEYSVYNGYVSYSDRNKMSALAYIAGSYADIGRSGRAYELLNKISHLSKTKSREMITAYAKLREWEKAMSLIKEDEFVLIDCPYIIIARQAVLSKRYDAAEMALNGAIKAVEKHDYFGVTGVYLLIKTADIFLSIGNNDRAVHLLNNAIELLSANKEDSYPQDNADILAKIAIVWIKTGDNSKGMKLLHESFEDIITMEDAFQKSEALSRIAKAYIDNNIAIKEKEREILMRIIDSCKEEAYDI
jgi:tetratricopeptide (TPR) repeat protein